ncbi:PREDICTED: F-box/FBD/LRR-repeat protein At1g13570-like [Erythranthe guttata]|uniref:F-box/FBD/LRR-repeat protein At1g13570-like n=1 Tax=Erythranthe guttata TaxID=4155 RepID=UPI00064DCECA|nr:PREDICTED: F-box/FBD/LRR-repeat protein At1g13570-like [Erythranthe guttata]|eukprot:XP_012829102.1 PREDICTED: F-box/FBD/LRR-repeat protein At1g13570-like [Erythranthe guttata]
MDKISELPKDILQRILYFLSQKEAIRTSLLSKSWRYTWCTRLNVDLDFSDVAFKKNKQKFIFVVNDTLQRYRDQRLCVEEFHLRISLGDMFNDLDHESVSLLEKWIPLLTVMGMKKFRLSVRSGHRSVKLPPVIFGAVSLQDLHLESFYFDRKAIERMLLFKHLKSLRLDKVCIEDEIFDKIIANFPSIETLAVEECIWLRTIKVDDLHNLKYLFFKMSYITRGEEELCRIEIHPSPSLETIDITNCNLWFHKGVDFRNLKELSLCHVTLSLDHLSSCKFPSLEYLKIFGWPGLRDSHLFIDAPNILYFQFAQDFVASISFAPTSGEWESDILLNFELSHVTSANIDHYLYSKWDRVRIEFLWKILMQRETGKEDQFSFRDLEEARMEIRGINQEEWHPISLSELPNDQERGYHFIRFALKWRQTL